MTTPVLSDNQDSFGPFLTNRFGESYLPSVNRETFLNTPAASVYEQYYGESLWAKDTLYIAAGSDSGLLIRHILQHGLPEGSRYLVVEPAGLLDRIRQSVVTEALPANLALVTPEQWPEQAERFAITDYFFLGNVRPFRSFAAMDAIHPEYLDLWNQINRHYVLYRFNVHMNTTADRNFFLKHLENLGENRHPAMVLQGCCRGKSAVLLAGGPSLHEFLPWVRANRERLAVLAVSRICRILIQEGIVPDMICSIDPDDTFLANSREMLVFWRDAIFVNMHHVHSGLLGQWRGRSVYLGPLLPWPSPLNRANYHFYGITVSHQLLGLAIEMGFSQVILLGFDLCFSREGFSHSQGSVEQALGPFMETSDLVVETNGGWQAETYYDFHVAIPALAALAAEGARQGCRVINPAAGAVKVAEVVHMPVAGLPLAEWSAWPGAVIAASLPEDGWLVRQAHYQAMIAELADFEAMVRVVDRLTAEAARCNERLFGRHGAPPEYQAKLRMDLIERTLDQDYREASRLVKRWGVAEFLKLSRPDREREWSDAEVEEIGRDYYRIYGESAQAVLEMLAGMRERVASRLVEAAADPDLPRLAEQWRRDRQPGRLLVFLDQQQKNWADLPEAWRETAQGLLADYERQQSDTDNEYERYCRNQINPRMVRAKALEFYRNRQADRLRAFAAGIAASVLLDKEQFGHLILGYAAEVAEALTEAESCYRQVSTPLLELEARLRLAHVTLKQGKNAEALAILASLQEQVPFCMPLYADLLRITGHLEESIQVWYRYLELVGMDLVAAFKLGRLLLGIGQLEEARVLFLRVAARHPDHEPVRRILVELA